jgi:hypothetical protein
LGDKLVSKIKVLLVYCKWQYNGPPVLSNFVSNLGGSFEAVFGENTDYELETVNIGKEPGEISTTAELSEVLLSRVYDIAVVSELDDCVMDIEVAKKIGKKLFLCNWDSNINISSNLEVNFRLFIKKPVNISFLRTNHSILEMSQYCNILSMDYGFGEIFPNIYAMYVPLDTRIFYNVPEEEKTNDILFCGSIHLEERASILNKLLSNGINVKIAGGRWPVEKTIQSFDEYASEFRKSKISLSFNASPYCRFSRKGRIIESMAAGSMCIMTYPDILKTSKGSWFEDGKHFASFNIDNCVSVVKYYLNNPDVRQRIALEGHNEWKRTCAPEVFWNRLFEIAGVK